MGQSNMDNPEKLATWTDKDKQNKKHNTICVGQHYMQTHTNNVIRHEPSYRIKFAYVYALVRTVNKLSL